MMKRLFALVMCVSACASTNAQLPTNTSNSFHKVDYNTVEVQCAKQTITQLYNNGEQYGKDIFIFHYKASDAWNYYLGCVLHQERR